jgi:hypothetical protein
MGCDSGDVFCSAQPMSLSTDLRTALWIFPLILQPLIALSIIGRKQTASLAMFLAYTLFVCGRDLVLLLLRNHKTMYVWTYWVGEPVTVLLGLAAICQVLWQLIRGYRTLRRLGMWLIPGTLLLDGIAAVVLLRLATFPKRGPLSIESVRLLERSAWFIEVGVLITFCFFILHLGLDWKRHGAGIIAGFGISAGLQLAIVELESLHLITPGIFPLFKSAAYDFAVLIWSVYFLFRREEEQHGIVVDGQDLRRVDELLETYLSQ